MMVTPSFILVMVSAFTKWRVLSKSGMCSEMMSHSL